MGKKQKLTWLLILQGWAMLWVVIGHSPLKMTNMPYFAQLLYDVAYSFHMPLFISISGYLFYMTRISTNASKQWTWNKVMCDKLVRLGIPFLVFTLIAMGMKSLFPDSMARKSEISIQELIHAVLYPREGPLMEMWFVAVLIWMFALLPLWRWCLKKLSLSIIVNVVFVLLCLFYDELHFGTFLCLKDAARFGIYFYIGILCSKYNIIDYVAKHKYGMLTISLVNYIVFFYLNISYLNIIVALSGITFSTALSFILVDFKENIFSSFREYTYQIFLISIFAQIAVKMTYKKLILGSVLGNNILVYVCFYVICILVGIYIPVLISKVLERIRWKPLLLCVGLK